MMTDFEKNILNALDELGTRLAKTEDTPGYRFFSLLSKELHKAELVCLLNCLDMKNFSFTQQENYSDEFLCKLAEKCCKIIVDLYRNISMHFGTSFAEQSLKTIKISC